MVDTKERILDAAEKLFAEHGFDAASLRAITKGAGVNLAAVNYHFNSKESLIQAVFSRRLAPLAEQRISMLNTCETGARGKPVALEKLVRAFVVPALRMMQDPGGSSASFGMLLGRMYSSPNAGVRKLFFGEIREGVGRFTEAFRRSLPGIPREEVLCRLFFSIGAMSHTMACGWLMPMISDGKADFSDVDRVIEQITAFIVAGLKAGASRGPKGRDRRRSTALSARPGGSGENQKIADG